MNKKWFTLVELVVTMSIIVILSAISFISYSSSIVTANNTQRKADLTQLDSSLKLFEKTNGRLPEAGGNTKNIGWVFTQWEMNGLEMNDLAKIPTDPKAKSQNYIYSKITYPNAEQEFQLSAVLEWEEATPLVIWNYVPVSSTYPSLIIVWNSLDPNNFVLDWNPVNVPYTLKAPFSENHKNWWIIDESEINKLIRHPYTTCEQIKTSKKFIWNVNYKTNNWKNTITCN